MEHEIALGVGMERRALEAIESLTDIEDQIKALDQTIRDLLQLVNTSAPSPPLNLDRVPSLHAFCISLWDNYNG